MDLKAVHAELGKLVAIDEQLRVIPFAANVNSLSLTGAEASQILNQRRAACQARLRELGFVAAHDSTAQTLREFRDREDRKAPAVPVQTERLPYAATLTPIVGTSPQDMRSASSLGFSD